MAHTLKSGHRTTRSVEDTRLDGLWLQKRSERGHSCPQQLPKVTLDRNAHARCNNRLRLGRRSSIFLAARPSQSYETVQILLSPLPTTPAMRRTIFRAGD